jgi:hypothetical protein
MDCGDWFSWWIWIFMVGDRAGDSNEGFQESASCHSVVGPEWRSGIIYESMKDRCPAQGIQIVSRIISSISRIDEARP